jgi:tetratricopeptide (TPR) repeat protein
VSLRLPFPRNELYVGRDIELGLLEQILVPKGSSHTHQRLTICGLGGSGKSALALEFAYCAMAKDARLKVFWVPAISQASFEFAYREIGLRLRIPGINDDNADVKKLVRDRLSLPSAGDWIIIVDNADDSNVLSGANGEQKSTNLIDWLPRSNRGSILFTTRNSKMAARLTLGNQNIYLAKLGAAEAGEMLRRRITKKHLISDDRTVDELLGKLDCLPLAITQATAFINSNEVTVARYLSLFQDTSTAEIFSKKFHDDSRYGSGTDGEYDGMDSTIAKTWHISFEQMRKQDPLAAEYLSFMACIDRINIPESILPPERSTLDHLESIGTLIGYAFITRQQQQAYGTGREDMYDMHRLVHMASALWLDAHEERATSASKVVDRLIDVVPREGHEGREVWIMYLPHAIYVADHDPAMTDPLKAAILNRVGRCQATLGQYSAAEATHQRAFLLRLNSLVEDHPQTLATMNEIGQALVEQGKYAAAEDIHRKTLKKRQKVLGDDDRFTLISMNNLAAVLRYQGKYDDAELMYRETLGRQKRVLEPGHSDILASTGNLALVLHDKHKDHEAEIFYREVLEGRTKLHGREHPVTMAIVSNLASVLSSQGKKQEAVSLTREALKHQENALGHDHPSTLISLNNLATFLNAKGTYDESETMYNDLLERRKKVLGPEHPDTITTMANLAVLLDNQGKPEAESLARESWRLNKRVLGEHHPETLMSIWCVALVLGHQKRYDEATSLYDKVYAELCAYFGKDNSHMLAEQDDARSVTSKLVSRVEKLSFRAWKPFAKFEGRTPAT